MKKKENKKMHTPRHRVIHNPIPTSLFSNTLHVIKRHKDAVHLYLETVVLCTRLVRCLDQRLSVIRESLQQLEEIALDCWLCTILLLLLSCIIFANISIKDLWK